MKRKASNPLCLRQPKPAVEFSWQEPPFIPTAKRRSRGASAEGRRYERRVHEHFLGAFPLLYAPAPWIKYYSAGGWRWCQPDAFFLDFRAGRVIVVEIKVRHTLRAWRQLRQLYEPLAKQILGTELWTYSVLEVVRWFDPHVAFPETLKFVDCPTHSSHDHFNLHICSL